MQRKRAPNRAELGSSQARHVLPRRLRGFTLIELMIVVVIVAILVGIAYPAYQDHFRKTRRAECAGTLVQLAGVMERHFSTQGSYLDASLGSTADDLFPASCPIDGNAPATYNLSITDLTATTYTLNAAPTGIQTGDPCGTLTLNHLGQKGVSGASQDAATCW